MTKTSWIVVLLVLMGLAGTSRIGLAAQDADYGAPRAAKAAELTVPMMLSCALQDEYLARGEYQKIMENLGTRLPFSNILRSEERHIMALTPLFEKYGAKLPADRGSELARVPDSWEAALKAGATAETENIKMYERFLAQDLPADVRSVFQWLQQCSRCHLNAFEGKGGLGQAGCGQGQAGCGQGQAGCGQGQAGCGQGKGNGFNGCCGGKGR